MHWKRLLPVMAAMALLVLVVAACGGETTPCPTCPTAAACPTCPTCPTCPEAAACPTAEACPAPEACPTCPEPAAGETTAAACPYQDEWAASAHADAEAEAFIHWNEEDPKETPIGCANCHSSTGFMDYVGADGSAVGVVDKAAPVGEVITCNACHSEAASAFDVIPFPSGITLTVEGPENRCMVCHQGRASAVQVDKKIVDSGVADDDTVSAKITFSNVHYKAAAATLYGAEVKGGYEYPGKPYDVKFEHEPGIDTCVDCHDSHTLELKVEGCYCHEIETAEDARDIREAGSMVDYDGDGDVEEGIYYEVQGLQESLLKAMQMYATEVSTQAIAYDEAAYPYWFGDANANGKVDEGEGGYKGWTGRLSKAAYNYQFSLKDSGAYAHNGKYIIELLYDSIEDLNTKLATPIDMENMNRTDFGHFDASAEAWRHWDEEPAVEAGCVRCHQAEGVPQFIESGANVAMPQSSSMQCSTCHNTAAWPALYEVTEVKLPSGKSVAFETAASNLCLECHQGRQSKVQVDRAVADKDPDTVIEGQRFINAHYLGIGAVWFGTDAQGFYEYDGKTYLGANAHMPVDGQSGCVGCHDVHTGTVLEELCATCHAGVENVDDIRMPTSAGDYNGNGNTTEGIRDEYRELRNALYAEIQAYAKNTVGTGITYNTDAYPYWFVDADGDDVADEKDGAAIGYSTWTPRLLKAAYNFNFFRKNPGAGAHNAKYAIQIIYDSIEDLGGDVTKYTRP